MKTSHDFDAAVVAKNQDGKVRIVKKHEQPTRHGAAVGLGWGLAVGVVSALFPPAGIGPVYEANLADQVAANIKAANRVLSKVTDMEADPLAAEMKQAEQENVATRDHLTEVIGGLERPPILMGHSAGGVFTQLMLDRGYGAVGVVMDSAPTEGVPVVPLSQLKSTFPALRTVGRKKAAGFTFEQWHYTFCNTFPEERSRQLYERYHIPASVRVLWGSALATLEPGHQDTFVNYDNDDRAPLLFISGTHDHLMPPSVQRSHAKHYKSKTVTEVKGFEGPAPAALEGRLGGGRRLRPGVGRPPRPPGQPPASTKRRPMTTTRSTHIGGPTALIEVGAGGC